MKNKIAACFLLMAGYSFSCDVCGCGAANTALGPGTIAAGNKSAFGINWQYRSFHSLHESFGMPSVYGVTVFNRMDAYANVRITRRWQVKAILPVVYNRETESGERDIRSGIADPSLSVNYFLFDRKDSLGKRQFRWSIGAGTKFPFAKFSDPDDENQFLNPGTGTWDALTSTTVFARWGNWGIISEGSFVLRGQNKYHYTPGNILNVSAYGFRKWETWSLFTGLQYMYSGDQYLNRHPVNQSPATGNIVAVSAGATVQLGNFMLQGNLQVPVIEVLSEPSTRQMIGANVGIAYFLN